jgi:hypothetical protein
MGQEQREQRLKSYTYNVKDENRKKYGTMARVQTGSKELKWSKF